MAEETFTDDYEAPDAQEELDAVEDAVDAEDLEVAPDRLPPLGRSWAYDFSGRGFIIQRGGPLDVRGLDALRLWIEKALRTARGAHAVYSDAFGMDYPTAEIGEPVSAVRGGELESRIEEALTVHPRIAGIEDFEATVDEDMLIVSFLVRLRGDEATALTISDLTLPGA